MEPGRADIIEAGATILFRFMEIGGHDEMKLTARGLRYGLVLRY
jgi:exopolyphosphatase/pppGpp-phosphohydrolase